MSRHKTKYFTIRIDADIWQILQRKRDKKDVFGDSPNSVLRRILGLKPKPKCAKLFANANVTPGVFEELV